MKRVEEILRQRIGLDAASVGSSLIERAVRLRMKALAVKQLPDYLGLLKRDESEWRELVESVVVSETWFFRDAEAFTALTLIAVNEKLFREPRQPLRLLSVPSSTGEEPYSLAMALLDAGVGADRFTVDAMDISARALERAQAGVYGRNAFRGKSLGFRDRHFRKAKEGHQISQGVRSCVRFHQRNLLDGGISPCGIGYDFIFCRNLLIYFDRPTQQRAMEILRGWLAHDGVLFVGPAETPIAAEHGFNRVDLPMAFACRWTEAPNAVPKFSAATANALANHHAPSAHARLDSAKPVTQDTPKVTPHATHKAPPSPDLAQVRELADAGKLDQALALGEEHLRIHGPSVEVYYLLGLVRDAQGDASALEFYRKALYLNPDHYESLLQASLLMDKLGDTAGAKSFRRRAERARKDTTGS